MRSILVLPVLALCWVSVPALAQYHGDDEPVSGELQGATRFHLELPMFRYLSVTRSFELGGVSESNTTNLVSLGGVSATGAEAGGFGFGVGYAIAPSFVLGTGFSIGYDSMTDPDVDDASSSMLTLGVEPYFEYLGGDGSTKPFIGVTLYARHRSETSNDPFDGTEQTRSRTLIGGGLIGGANFFVGEACSIDLTGKLTYGMQSGGEPALEDGESLSLLDFLVTIGVSAWVL